MGITKDIIYLVVYNYSIIFNNYIIIPETFSTAEECGDIYCDKISNKPSVRCYICKLGKHECQEQNLRFVYEDTQLLNNKKGVMWMCFDCREFVKDGKLVEKNQRSNSLRNYRKEQKKKEIENQIPKNKKNQ